MWIELTIEPKVAGDGRLQREQDEGVLLGLGAHRGDLLVVGDHLLGEHQIGLQKCLCCVLHGNTGQPTHLTELFGELKIAARGTRYAWSPKRTCSILRDRHEPVTTLAV